MVRPRDGLLAVSLRLAGPAVSLPILLLLWLFGAGIGSAQEAGTGSIAGVVKSSASGAGIAGATVSVPGQADSTEADGGYRLVGLAAGSYTVTVAVTNYPSQAKTVTVPANGTAGVNFLVGGLTKAEQQSVQWIIWAANGNRPGDAGTLHDTNSGQLDQIISNQTTGTTREPLRKLKDLVRQAQITLDLAVADLLGAQIAPLGQPRRYYVERAKGRIATIKTTTIPAILSAADAAKAAGAAGVYPWTMDRYKAGINGVLAKLTLFNATLAYADPLPPSRSKDGTRVTIIGPHGDYIRSMTWFGTAINRVNNMYAATIAGYGADAVLPSYWNKYQQMKFTNSILQKIGVAMGSINGMQFAGYSTDPFFRVLGIFESLTHGGGGPVTPENDCKDATTGRDTCHGLSYEFNNVMLFTRADDGQMATRPTHAAQQLVVKSEITEAWQATQTAEWYMLAFPECERTGGCGGAGG